MAKNSSPLLTPEERQAGIGLKCLIIARDQQGQIARVMSPHTAQYWTHDGATWTLTAHAIPAADNQAGIHVAYTAKTCREYRGSLCKVILSGVIIEHEGGARGERARLLEVLK